jgi:hypothetical protein
MVHQCKICGYKASDLKGLSNHINSIHKMKTIDYVITHLYNGIRPLCPICGKETRYSTYSFKEYCKDHSRNAEVKGGKKGGKSSAWNKGKTKDSDNRIKSQSIKVSGSANHFYGKVHSEDSKNLISTSKRLGGKTLTERMQMRNDLRLVTPVEEYVSRQKQYLDFECVKCLKISRKTLKAFEEGSLCPYCYPSNTSIDEKEVRDFLEENSIVVSWSNREVISPKELDLFLPDFNFAIEYNGLYWHSEDNKGDKNYHKSKTVLCECSGVDLFHIFSDEWKYKKELVKSMILHRLNRTETRIYARNCSVGIWGKSSAKEFFNKNHIAGSVGCSIPFVLVHNCIPVACLTLRKPRHRKYKGYIEIARFANLINCHVVGGFSKLLSMADEWARNNGYKGILTYADLRFGTGNVYAKNGFEVVGDTEIDYWYTDGDVRFDRFKFRSRDGKSEKEVANESGVSRIYGCGSRIYLMKF